MTDVDTRPRQQEPVPERPPSLGPRELLRWAWRQLTSMRTALILLLLLALAAVPGSVIPQQGVDAQRTSAWKADHPALTPIYERLGLFSVYSSAWFAAVYLLLVLSLVGCIVPRTAVYWRAFRAPPPRAPRNLARLPDHRTWTTTDEPSAVLARAREVLAARYRLAAETPEAADSVSAERGRLREAGNLVFHLAVLVVLAGFGMGALWGFKGGVIVVTGDSFSNTLSQYDDFVPGRAFGPDDLKPFEFTVDDFHVTFIRSGRSAGAATRFNADLAVRRTPGAAAQVERISVNHPLTIDGTKVFLVGHGYAPHITIRDGEGHVVTPKATVFLPEDASFTSFGVVKAQDAQPDQIGLEGELYPTYAFTDKTGPFSAFPDDRNPVVSMLAYRGDLGLDDGTPQSIYTLDKSRLTPIRDADGKPLRLDLGMGKTATLPDGLGTVTFDGMSRFVRLQVSERPGSGVALTGMVLALAGLLCSLYVRPRRVWVRVRRAEDRTIVELAALDRSSGGDPTDELDRIAAELGRQPRTEEST